MICIQVCIPFDMTPQSEMRCILFPLILHEMKGWREGIDLGDTDVFLKLYTSWPSSFLKQKKFG